MNSTNEPFEDVSNLSQYKLLSICWGCLGLSHTADEVIAGTGMDFTRFVAQHVLHLPYEQRLRLLQKAVNTLVTKNPHSNLIRNLNTPTLSKLVILRQQALDSYAAKRKELTLSKHDSGKPSTGISQLIDNEEKALELNLLSEKCGKLATAIVDLADEEQFIVQDGTEFIFVHIDIEERCILVQKKVPLIKEQ